MTPKIGCVFCIGGERQVVEYYVGRTKKKASLLGEALCVFAMLSGLVKQIRDGVVLIVLSNG